MVATRIALASLIALQVFAVGSCKKNTLKRSKDSPSVVVRNPDVSDSVPSESEREPNDSVATAQIIANPTRFRIDATLPLNPKGQPDQDFFRFVVPGVAPVLPDGGDARQVAVRLSLTLTSQASPLFLTVLDGAGKAIASFSAEQGKPSSLPNLAVVPGSSYVLKAKGKGGSGKSAQGDSGAALNGYMLEGELGQFAPGDERESNDSLLLSEPLAPFKGATEKAGFASPTRDEDWYRVPLPAIPSVLGLEVGSVDGVSISLRVVNAQGNKLAAASGNRGSVVSLRNVSIPAAAPDAGLSEAIYAVVRTESGQNPSERYVLQLMMGPAEAGTEVEPNDDFQRANDLDSLEMRGYLSRGDVDVFRYKGKSGQGIRVTVLPPGRAKVVVEITRATDGQLLGRESTKSPKTPVIVTCPNLGMDTAYIRISPQKGEGNPNQPYTVSVVEDGGSNPADLP